MVLLCPIAPPSPPAIPRRWPHRHPQYHRKDNYDDRTQREHHARHCHACDGELAAGEGELDDEEAHGAAEEDGGEFRSYNLKCKDKNHRKGGRRKEGSLTNAGAGDRLTGAHVRGEGALEGEVVAHDTARVLQHQRGREALQCAALALSQPGA